MLNIRFFTQIMNARSGKVTHTTIVLLENVRKKWRIGTSFAI